MPNDSLWTGGTLDDLRRELGDVYEGRTVLVTGADGFMGSHLTDALVELGAIVHAFVRANSSGALNNISHLRDRLKVHFADLTDRTSVDYLVRELRQAPDRPYVFHLGAIVSDNNGTDTLTLALRLGAAALTGTAFATSAASAPSSTRMRTRPSAMYSMVAALAAVRETVPCCASITPSAISFTAPAFRYGSSGNFSRTASHLTASASVNPGPADTA